ncbi:MAG: ABC transporter ATP-binding protein [Candidatus Bathyarchaeota archaeon]|nr:ABC transporter ATP-binding protein [Candidatus Bathyarchaeota archaeon]
MKVIVETVDLVKEYRQAEKPLRVLNGVNLRVVQGEFMAIMGPSGSGKSTLLNMLGALDRPTSGRVLINGVDLSTLGDNELADLRNREFGFIFQTFNLIPRMDALGNVELPLAIAGVSRGERRERASKLLEAVGLGDRMDHKPSQLSGGEQQRVAIARALVNDPSVMLCDEVTGNLDTRTGDEIMQILRSLNVDQGKTFIIVTHDPAVAQSSDRLIQLWDGQIAGEKRLRREG